MTPVTQTASTSFVDLLLWGFAFQVSDFVSARTCPWFLCCFFVFKNTTLRTNAHLWTRNWRSPLLLSPQQTQESVIIIGVGPDGRTAWRIEPGIQTGTVSDDYDVFPRVGETVFGPRWWVYTNSRCTQRKRKHSTTEKDDGPSIVSAATCIGLSVEGVVAGTVTLFCFMGFVRLSLNRTHIFAPRVLRIICSRPLSSYRCLSLE